MPRVLLLNVWLVSGNNTGLIGEIHNIMPYGSLVHLYMVFFLAPCFGIRVKRRKSWTSLFSLDLNARSVRNKEQKI